MPTLNSQTHVLIDLKSRFAYAGLLVENPDWSQADRKVLENKTEALALQVVQGMGRMSGTVIADDAGEDLQSLQTAVEKYEHTVIESIDKLRQGKIDNFKNTVAVLQAQLDEEDTELATWLTWGEEVLLYAEEQMTESGHRAIFDCRELNGYIAKLENVVA